jgi:NAD(P)-dependent dehydrogenase (short-subunit alcohol dehydrogenase family)/acyl dehydratase/putative sterol carrier protein
MTLLKDKVAIVTGAGGGLGRSHALAFAREGAKVVVNDPGVNRDGTAGGGRPADAVVEEIRKAGGQAVASYDSVTDGAEKIVAKAVEAFGRVDILVNNAGILRDKTIHNMSDEMWDAVVAVHLRGTFACTRAAARVMKEKGTGGRIVNTTSVAGLKGNFGQSNYSAAKAGIYGFTLTAAMELGKDGITVNAIAPIAKTRMTDDIESVPAEYKAEDVSPVVVFLASDLAKDVTGRILGVHGRHLFEYRMEMTAGVEKKDAWTVEQISEFVHAPPVAAAPASASAGGNKIAAVFKALPGAFDAAKAAGWESTMHFVVAGAGEWGVEVKDQKVKVVEGAPAAPTCVITVDADTLGGMVEGKVKGDMAFMAGKLKATKVPDLGKFGKVFDFKKLKAAVEVSGAPPAVAKAAAPAAALDLPALLGRLPGQFLPDKAAGFNGSILFKVDGQAATLEIKDKLCAIRPPTATPTCTLTTDAATLGALLEGTLDGQKAMQDGKVKVTHLPSWLKFRQMFRFEPEKGLKRVLVGRLYTAAPILLQGERMAAYGEVVGDPDSPVFPVTLIKEPFTKLFSDPDFTGDFSRMVHGEQVFTFHQPLRPLDLLSVRGRVLSIEDKSSGQLLNFGTRLYCEGELRVEMESRLFFRGESKGAPAAGEKAAPPARPAPAKTFETTSALDLPKRYAAVSGDDNPIHLDDALAKSVGFKGVILHGLSTLALVAKQLPRPLHRLEVRFAKPVYPGEVLRTSLWPADGGLLFETANAAGEVVLANGRALS